MTRLRFGVLTFPVHRPTHDPTLQLQTDLELADHCDRLGYDEFWFGEHHSGGWQTIGSPELMIAAAAQRTHRIRLGTGVSTLSHHHPFTLADRIVQLDHMPRGRLIFGFGAGALAQDSLMMGRDPMQSRRRMEEAMEVIERLLACDGPVDAETDWFTLRGARLHLRPYSDELGGRVACFRSPAGPRLAGRSGAGMLQFGASAAIGGGSENPMTTAWGQAQARAQQFGRTVDRSRWSVVPPVHVAPTEAQARAEVAWGLPHYVRFVRQVLPMNVPVDLDDADAVIDVLQTVGHLVVGTPEQAAAHIEAMQEISGGFGTFVIEHGELADPEASKRSYDLFVREVTPRFTGQSLPRVAAWERELASDSTTRRTMAAAQARAGVEHEVDLSRVRAQRREAARAAAAAAEQEAPPAGHEGAVVADPAPALARDRVPSEAPVAAPAAASSDPHRAPPPPRRSLRRLVRAGAPREDRPMTAPAQAPHDTAAAPDGDVAAAPTTVDVVVLGSGIGGSTVAAILARQGVSVAIVDGATHPRFALGESTVGETTFLLRQLAARWDVPELAQVSTGAGLAEHVSRRCGTKTNFGFVYQREHLEHETYEVTQCNVTHGPFGPESHLMRGDVDEHLYHGAVRHGAIGREGVRVAEVDLREDGVGVHLADGSSFEARYVVDTSSGQPTPWHESTLHHLFDGGWMWVIPFDNREGSESDLVSVGLSFDTRSNPKREGVTPEQEWADFLSRFPTVARQFEHAEPAFPWISTGRTQFSSERTVGDRWILMSHAAGAVDALFSRGMANTMAVIEAFVPRFLAALADDDLSAERFAYVDTLNQALLDNNDKLIAGSYIAFHDFDLWRAWSKMWFLAWNLGVMRIAGSYYRYLETGEVAELDRLHAGVLPGTWAPELVSAQEQFDTCYAIMKQVEAGEKTPEDAVPELAFLLGDGEASPSPLILHDVLRRWHDGSAQAQELLYQWGRTTGPEALRPYFAYDRATIALAAEKVLSAGRARRAEQHGRGGRRHGDRRARAGTGRLRSVADVLIVAAGSLADW